MKKIEEVFVFLSTIDENENIKSFIFIKRMMPMIKKKFFFKNI